MKVVMRLEEPGEIEATLSLTLPVSEWKRLREQLGADYPSWRLGQAISALVGEVERFVAFADVKEGP